MFSRIKAYIRRRRTQKQIKKMTKAGREAAVRLNEANAIEIIATMMYRTALIEFHLPLSGDF